MIPINRLRWRCRRGMRELDIVLERFLDRRYHQLAEADQLRFAELLDQADQDIMAWLLGTSQPGDPGSLKLIDDIRSTSGEL
ncbi:MAG: succinate dehydrogenase assembly factor 2 [Gammaproteobacteria bacterium]|nr:succinate dehydrogenase assembly factor 2 [Gammaproteobacteria bacterium]